MLPQLHVRDASPQPRVTTGRDGQTYQVSPAHLNPLLCMSHTHRSHQHHHQRHQTLSSRHIGQRREEPAGRVDERWGWVCEEREGCVVTYEVILRGLYSRCVSPGALVSKMLRPQSLRKDVFGLAEGKACPDLELSTRVMRTFLKAETVVKIKTWSGNDLQLRLKNITGIKGEVLWIVSAIETHKTLYSSLEPNRGLNLVICWEK